MTEFEQNQRTADLICHDFRLSGQTFQTGQWVALLDGAVVAVSTNVEEALQALRSIEPDASRGMLVEVAKPVVDVIR